MKLIDFLDLISPEEFLLISYDIPDFLNHYIFMGHKNELTSDFIYDYNPDLNVIHAMPMLPEFGFEDNGLVLIVE